MYSINQTININNYLYIDLYIKIYMDLEKNIKNTVYFRE